MRSWIEFWNADNPIYVNDRHKMLHYRGLASDIRDLIPGEDDTILDFGCGEALSAGLVAARCRKLILVDAAPTVREKLSARFGDIRTIQILAPEDLKGLPDGSLDLIVVHSVAQYVAKADFATLIHDLARLLRPNGSLILGDVLPVGLSPLVDARALLSFGWQGGFLIPALVGLVKTALSDYRTIRTELGLTHYEESEILALLDNVGLTARRLDRNLGHNQARMAFAAVRFSEPPSA
jgi:SAM-dependent methyltransferase